MPLPTRKIGNDDVACIGFGAMGMSAFYSTQSRAPLEENLRVLRKAIDYKCYIDTADIYGDKEMGENERLIAHVIQGENRQKAFIATKFGNLRHPDGTYEIRGDREYIMQAVEKSLEALGTSVIDLYYQHRVDKRVPIEESVKAMKELQDAGKIRYIGLSEASEDDIRRAFKVAKIDALQIELSPFTPDVVKNGILDACKELGIALVAYSPLGRGALTGTITKLEDLDEGDFRKTNPRFAKEAFDHNMKLVNEIKAIAEKKGCTPGQISLAWVLAQGENVIPIPGTKREKYLEENIRAADVHLTKEDLAALDDIIYKFEMKGTRYHPSMMDSVPF